MKRITIAGLSVLGMGVIVFIGGFALSGWNIAAINTEEPYTKKTYTAPAQYSAIEIEDKNTEAVLTVSPDEKIHITYYENEKNVYDLKEGEILSFKKTEKYQWYEYFFNINFQKTTLEIQIPKDYTGDLILRTSNAKIEAKNLSAQNMKLLSSNGAILLDTVHAEEQIHAETSNGSVEMKNISSENSIQAVTSNASIVFEKAESADTTALTSNGRIMLSEIQAENISAQTSNASVRLTDVQAENSLTLQSSNGSIEGTVKGTLADFSVVSHTSNADSNLPEAMPGGEKQLTVQTSNGKIDIQFRS